MAKKKTGYEPVGTWEPDEPAAPAPEPVDVAEPVGTDFYVLDAPTTYTPSPDLPQGRVRTELPMTALFALIDAASPRASVADAEYYGLLAHGSLTPIGEKVLAGCDVTALRHQIYLAQRETKEG